MCTKETRARHLKRATELKAQYEELKRQYESEKKWIEAEMTAGGLSELEAGGLTAKMTAYSRTSLDSRRFKTEMPELYKAYSKTTEAKRFTIV